MNCGNFCHISSGILWNEEARSLHLTPSLPTVSVNIGSLRVSIWNSSFQKLLSWVEGAMSIKLHHKVNLRCENVIFQWFQIDTWRLFVLVLVSFGVFTSYSGLHFRIDPVKLEYLQLYFCFKFKFKLSGTAHPPPPRSLLIRCDGLCCKEVSRTN